ncbi:uncharacterized protein GIQ15_01868 [Arthroderma uncinatum]|uniref:uncharacterized protein n=1 Tax=Arthroderma uncinatum TaxID=74035 RepID=UPI00144A970B|nr:uncharacterized protein GIQ15_01868 [Arthroderma uncinatum]KAF3492351.1 hypothetical protein GIQ15_01868 [Arthroderma uncinatum]
MGWPFSRRSKLKKQLAAESRQNEAERELYRGPQQAPSERYDQNTTNIEKPYTNIINFDKDCKNGTGAIAIDFERDLNIIVRFNEHRNERQPSHRIYRTTEHNRLHEIGVLWERTSLRGVAYYGVDMQVFNDSFKGYLWPDNGSRTVWKIIRS